MNKFFTNKVPQVTKRVYKNVLQALEALKPYFKESEGIQASVAAFLQDSPLKFFFLRVVSRKKEEKVNTDKLPTRRVIRFAVEFFFLRFAQFKESEGFFYNKLRTRAMIRVS
jgi:hypothetical protein